MIGVKRLKRKFGTKCYSNPCISCLFVSKKRLCFVLLLLFIYAFLATFNFNYKLPLLKRFSQSSQNLKNKSFSKWVRLKDDNAPGNHFTATRILQNNANLYKDEKLFHNDEKSDVVVESENNLINSMRDQNSVFSVKTEKTVVKQNIILTNETFQQKKQEKGKAASFCCNLYLFVAYYTNFISTCFIKNLFEPNLMCV